MKTSGSETPPCPDHRRSYAALGLFIFIDNSTSLFMVAAQSNTSEHWVYLKRTSFKLNRLNKKVKLLRQKLPPTYLFTQEVRPGPQPVDKFGVGGQGSKMARFVVPNNETCFLKISGGNCPVTPWLLALVRTRFVLEVWPVKKKSNACCARSSLWLDNGIISSSAVASKLAFGHILPIARQEARSDPVASSSSSTEYSSCALKCRSPASAARDEAELVAWPLPVVTQWQAAFVVLRRYRSKPPPVPPPLT